MNRLFESLRNLIWGRGEEDELDASQDGFYDDALPHNQGERQLFTALDIGTAYAKAIIIEVNGDHAEVLGVGRHGQSYSHMSDGIVTDIPGVIANCNQALLQAEQAAGGIVAPAAVIGIAVSW